MAKSVKMTRMKYIYTLVIYIGNQPKNTKSDFNEY